MSTEEERRKADEMLRRMEEELGFVPLVSQVLSERPDLFIPNCELFNTVFEGEGKRIDAKTTRLIALSASVALGAEHCAKVQATVAKEFGATREEILETMHIASLMAMNRSQAYGFRAFKEVFRE